MVLGGIYASGEGWGFVSCPQKLQHVDWSKSESAVSNVAYEENTINKYCSNDRVMTCCLIIMCIRVVKEVILHKDPD